MPYSRTPRTIQKVKEQLDEMVECDIDLEWAATNPRKVAYNIWQAIKFSVKSGKKEYEEYAKLGSKFEIRVGKDYVQAKLKTPAIVHGTTFRDVEDVLGIIGVAIGLRLKIMLFPKVVKLNLSDQKILESWCEGNGYRWNIGSLGTILNKRNDA